MSQKDQEKWDRKYLENPHLREERPPSRWLEEYLPESGGGVALDVACGTGRNTLWLARHGWQVDAVDISPVALQILTEAAQAAGVSDHITTYLLDLERFVPPRESYDLIVKTNYLDRPLMDTLKKLLKSGGIFIVEAYLDHPDNAKEGLDPDFLLQAAELPLLFADYTILAYEEYPNDSFETHRMMKAGIVAKKP